MPYFIGIDVGTGSVRAAVVSHDGVIHGASAKTIRIWNPKPDFYEQSSANIWKRVCEAVREAVEESNVKKEDIVSLAFDGTCSLVVVNQFTKDPYDISNLSSSSLPHANNEIDSLRNIILWMDHRAKDETAYINSIEESEAVLQYVGGKISAEMEIPKILWLKNNTTTKEFSEMEFYELPDYLTFKATGISVRSLCSVVCKWTYLSSRMSTKSGINGWDDRFIRKIGLNIVAEKCYSVFGQSTHSPMKAGERIGCITAQAAFELGLSEKTVVASPLIDAYAGYVGCIGAGMPRHLKLNDPLFIEIIEKSIVLICGTSSCHVASNSKQIFTKGVWGPFDSVVFPGFSFAEGGQSVAGKLLQWTIDSHPASALAAKFSKEANMNIFDYLHKLLDDEAQHLHLASMNFLTSELHVLPDVHGNRSPLADVSLKGMVVGITLDDSVLSLAVLYLATIQSLAYGSKHIVEALNSSGYAITESFISGGLSKNLLFVQTHADVLGFPVRSTANECNFSSFKESFVDPSVVVGSAMLAAAASNYFENGLVGAISSMTAVAKTFAPTDSNDTISFHRKKYRVMMKMLQHQKEYQLIMS